MKFMHRLIVTAIVPPEIFLHFDKRNQAIDTASSFISSALKISPFFIQGPEFVFRVFLCPFLIALKFLPLSDDAKYRICVATFNICAPSRSLFRMYQSLAFFVLFETATMTSKLGLPSQNQRQQKFRDIKMATQTQKNVGS